MCLWNWLAQLPQGSASFLGSVAGSSLGLIAILLGALFNARLNRNRDDRLRDEDRIALASALHAELKGIHRALIENAQHLKEKPPADDGGFVVPKLTIKILPEIISKIGLLKSETVQAVMGAYILSEQYLYKLVLAGGQLQSSMPADVELVYVPTEKARFVVALNEVTAEGVQTGVDALACYLK